jgi:D-alanyl-D-alanine carboxypeptidase
MRAAALVFAIIALLGADVRQVQAGPALLLEADTGKILYMEDPDDQWHPASLTKIMTAYLTFLALKNGWIMLDEKIPYSENASRQVPSKIGLPVGATMIVNLALEALIVKSANDVAVMLAEAIGGTEEDFVEMMNAAAAQLGMTRTYFANPNGLPDPRQVTTARDLAKLSRDALRRFPEHAHYWSMHEMRIGKRRLRSHNSLLNSFDGADGLKTGFICDSGYNVVATATRDGKQLMAVVLGGRSGEERSIRASSLLEHGFQSIGWKQIFNTTTVDNLPFDSAARDVLSVRRAVLNGVCGGRRPTARAQRAAARARIRAQRAAAGK